MNIVDATTYFNKFGERLEAKGATRSFTIGISTKKEVNEQHEEFANLAQRANIPIPPDDLPGWYGVVRDRDLEYMVNCQFGMAEEVIALMVFTDKTFEVGIGESLRPYIKVYTGSDEKLAIKAFENSVYRSLDI